MLGVESFGFRFQTHRDFVCEVHRGTIYNQHYHVKVEGAPRGRSATIYNLLDRLKNLSTGKYCQNPGWTSREKARWVPPMATDCGITLSCTKPYQHVLGRVLAPTDMSGVVSTLMVLFASTSREKARRVPPMVTDCGITLCTCPPFTCGGWSASERI